MMLPRLHQEVYLFWPKPGGGNSPSQPNHNKITTDSSDIPQDIGLAFCSEGFGTDGHDLDSRFVLSFSSIGLLKGQS